MTDLMVDIESLGSKKNSSICQIGACYFDRNTGEIGNTFKVNIDPIDAEKYGCELDASTVLWWLSQSDAARNSILADPKLPVIEAMKSFLKFIEPAKTIWSHATFDFVMLNETCIKLGIGRMPFRKARDIRTLVDLGKVTIKKVEREGTHHDALDDAIFQVKYCVQCFQNIKRRQDASSSN